jgi:hypothetical protein
MVAGTDKKANKTAFVTEHLGKNPSANAAAVRAAWADAGNPGSISTTLVQKIRNELGLTGNIRGGRRPGSAKAATKPTRSASGKSAGARSNGKSAASSTHSEAAKAAPRRGDRERMLHEIEGEIDGLIFKLMTVGGMGDVEEALRRARRQVVRSHKA